MTQLKTSPRPFDAGFNNLLSDFLATGPSMVTEKQTQDGQPRSQSTFAKWRMPTKYN